MRGDSHHQDHDHGKGRGHDRSRTPKAVSPDLTTFATILLSVEMVQGDESNDKSLMPDKGDDHSKQPPKYAVMNSSASHGSSHSSVSAAKPSPGEKVHVLLSPIPMKQGLQRKATAYSLKSWIALSLTLDGRDKITKVFQYWARFLAWWLSGSNSGERLANLKVSLTTSRKAFRLGRSLNEFDRLRNMHVLEALRWQLLDYPRDRPQKSADNILAIARSVALRLFGVGKKKPDGNLVDYWSSAIKSIGLMGFFGFDNLVFLTQSGLFDSGSKPKDETMAKRKKLSTRFSVLSNRFYFVGSVAGLVASSRTYMAHRREKLLKLKRKIEDAKDVDEQKAAVAELDKAQEKQFALFVALLKSCCDVLVFSNNPGIDLWRKGRGKPMHEGFHCLCGFTSAATVLYNNFPDA